MLCHNFFICCTSYNVKQIKVVRPLLKAFSRSGVASSSRHKARHAVLLFETFILAAFALADSNHSAYAKFWAPLSKFPHYIVCTTNIKCVSAWQMF